jgi:hypothetical protein
MKCGGLYIIKLVSGEGGEEEVVAAEKRRSIVVGTRLRLYVVCICML